MIRPNKHNRKFIAFGGKISLLIVTGDSEFKELRSLHQLERPFANPESDIKVGLSISGRDKEKCIRKYDSVRRGTSERLNEFKVHDNSDRPLG